MDAVNVSGKGSNPKKKRNKILPGHARRAYERFQHHAQTQTDESGESTYGAADDLLRQIGNGTEGELSPFFQLSGSHRKGASENRGAVNISGNVQFPQRTTATAPSTKAAHRYRIQKWFSAKKTTTAKPKTKKHLRSLRNVIKGTTKSVRSILAAAKTLILSISAGGWVAIVLVLICCVMGMLVSSPFGVFFSGEDTGTGQTMVDAVRAIDTEYSERLTDLRSAIPHDAVEMSGTRAVWPDILAVYAVKTASDLNTPMEAASMTDDKIQLLKDIFWQMNEISHSTQTVTRTEIRESADENGNIIEEEQEVTRTILTITISQRTAAEMASELNFNEVQLRQIEELLSEDYRSLWSSVLYGIHSSNEQLIAVALSQVGNVGGELFWSWYGFESRVEWCACFVCWCSNECGYIDLGILPKFASCRNGMLWFQSRGQWLPGTAEPSPGMIVFFDWDDENGQDGLPDHVGIVYKVEDGMIYTIEGNSGDACKVKMYPSCYYEILGFGTTYFS